MTEMSDVYHMTLLPDTNEEAFLAFVQQEGFPLAAVTRAGTVTNQYLWKEYDAEDGTCRYLWVVRWTLHFELEALEQVAESLWKARQQLESQVEITSFNRYIQAAESM